MTLINRLINAISDVIFLPFQGFDPWVAMVVISAVTGVIMLMIFKRTSNQRAIRRIKDRIKGHILEALLFKDDFLITLRTQGSLFLCAFKYMGYSFAPMAVMLIPVVLILVQLEQRYGHRALQVGEAAVVSVSLREGMGHRVNEVTLHNDPGIVHETPSVRISSLGQVHWRVHAEEEGLILLQFEANGVTIEKNLTVGKGLHRCSAIKFRTGFWNRLLYPSEPPLPRDGIIESIEVAYPGQSLLFLGWDVHWLVAFFILSIVFGFALKGTLGVEV